MTFGLKSSSSPETRFPLSAPALPGLAPLLPGLEPEFTLPALTASIALVFALPLPAALSPEVDGAADRLRTGRCRNFGAGKLDFLSIASTVRWKRRKRASARMRVDSKSIVVESSFTVSQHQYIVARKGE
jgi:hypothetical protein